MSEMEKISITALQELRKKDKAAYLQALDLFTLRELPQKDRILKYLKDKHSITPKDAMEKLGIMRLGARIWELVREGWPIGTETETAQNCYGQTTQYARYRRAA